MSHLASYLAERYGATTSTAVEPSIRKKRRRKPKTANMMLVEDDSDALPAPASHESYFETGADTDALAVHDATEADDAEENKAKIDAKKPRFKPLGVDEDEVDEPASKRPHAGGLGEEARAARARHDSPDASPPRRTRHDSPDASPPRRARHDSPDASPPRRARHDSPDASPPRRTRHNSPDASPPRRTRHDSPDASPPRRARHDSPDASPPRRTRHDSPDASPPRRTRHDSPDASPPRRARHDASPPRRQRQVADDVSPPRRPVADLSPPRSRVNADDDALLKAGGLQNAAVLREDLRRREELKARKIAELGADAGIGAETIHRDKSGKILDARVERHRKRAADVAQAEAMAKHMEWGRGLKQTQDRERKLEEEVKEMAKPLARYADDEDLNQLQKSRILPEDPMAAYMMEKQEKAMAASGKPQRRRYQGQAPPNRFNVVPGWSWDGRDRSNGFEARWFKKQVNSKALQGEAYKWSTSDM